MDGTNDMALSTSVFSNAKKCEELEIRLKTLEAENATLQGLVDAHKAEAQRLQDAFAASGDANALAKLGDDLPFAADAELFVAHCESVVRNLPPRENSPLRLHLPAFGLSRDAVTFLSRVLRPAVEALKRS